MDNSDSSNQGARRRAQQPKSVKAAHKERMDAIQAQLRELRDEMSEKIKKISEDTGK